MTEPWTRRRIALAVMGLAMALCFMVIPLTLFVLWYMEIGRAAEWHVVMCLMPWVPGCFFAYCLSGSD